MGLVSLIVMEPGSDWPGHVAGAEKVIAFGEHEEGLLPRIRQKSESLRHGGERIRVAILACNEAADGASLVRRTELARELLAVVASSTFGRLVLSAAEHTSMQLRHELLALASALSESRPGAATVSVRFRGAKFE